MTNTKKTKKRNPDQVYSRQLRLPGAVLDYIDGEVRRLNGDRPAHASREHNSSTVIMSALRLYQSTEENEPDLRGDRE